MNDDVWYHGSPLQLDLLAPGSTITRERRVAEVFSHKPPLVCFEDDGRIRHNGRANGYLYLISEVAGPQDVEPHPRSTMPPGVEWLTRRPFRLACLGPTDLSAEELLSDDEAHSLVSHGMHRKDGDE